MVMVLDLLGSIAIRRSFAPLRGAHAFLVAIMKRCMPENTVTQHTHYMHCWYHQGIRNDDQSLSPLTPPVSFTFSVVLNPLKCSGTFFSVGYKKYALIMSYMLNNSVRLLTRL